MEGRCAKSPKMDVYVFRFEWGLGIMIWLRIMQHVVMSKYIRGLCRVKEGVKADSAGSCQAIEATDNFKT